MLLITTVQSLVGPTGYYVWSVSFDVPSILSSFTKWMTAALSNSIHQISSTFLHIFMETPEI
jgi:hypothetical protein